MKVQIKMIPNEIIEEYNLESLIHNGQILIRIDKGIYGLPHAGQIAYNKLKIHLKKERYISTGFISSLFKDESRPKIILSG